MPQMNKGGKFIFGKSLIRSDLTVYLPVQAIKEYNATAEGKVYLFTGSKITGGFCVTRKGLLEPSKLWHILTDTRPESSIHQIIKAILEPNAIKQRRKCPFYQHFRCSVRYSNSACPLLFLTIFV